MKNPFWRLLALCLALFLCPVAAHAKRIALVIGNNKYQHVATLQKAGNDAEAMARELKAAGFEVLLHRELDYRRMVRAFESLYNSITGGDEVVVFFAGHGVQIKNGSYLLPIDIEATSESEVEKTSYALNDLLEQLTVAKAAFALVLVDACRDNPLKSRGRSVGSARGLNPPDPPKGQTVVYSASRGQQALDRLSDKDTNPNSLFTREFVSRMRRPGLRLEELVREIQDSVETLARSVSHEQRPAMYNEARGSFYFFAPVAAVPAASAATGLEEARREDRFWDDAKSAGNKEGFEAYLDQYPKGRYANLARANINRLVAASVVNPNIILTSANVARPVAPATTVSAPPSAPGLAKEAVPPSAAAVFKEPAPPSPSAVFKSAELPSLSAVLKESAPPPPSAVTTAAAPPAAPKAAAAPFESVVLASLGPSQKTRLRMVLPNGDRYEGEVIGTTRTGHGIYTFANGDRYEGEFADNLFHGKGTQTLASGDVYTGDFDRGVKSGQGIFTFANGGRYEGAFVQDQFHGKGKQVYASGDSSEGDFVRGIKQGPGGYRFANGDRFEGNFVDDLFSGRGVFVFANGERYEGEFRNNVKDGEGIHFFANGDRYEGTFRAGMQAGTGTHFYANGDKYTGQFADGVRHGKGTYTFVSGGSKEYEFDNGVVNGN